MMDRVQQLMNVRLNGCIFGNIGDQWCNCGLHLLLIPYLFFSKQLVFSRRFVWVFENILSHENPGWQEKLANHSTVKICLVCVEARIKMWHLKASTPTFKKHSNSQISLIIFHIYDFIHFKPTKMPKFHLKS